MSHVSCEFCGWEGYGIVCPKCKEYKGLQPVGEKIRSAADYRKVAEIEKMVREAAEKEDQEE
jgi:hypothetical protein